LKKRVVQGTRPWVALGKASVDSIVIFRLEVYLSADEWPMNYSTMVYFVTRVAEMVYLQLHYEMWMEHPKVKIVDEVGCEGENSRMTTQPLSLLCSIPPLIEQPYYSWHSGPG